MTDHEFEITIRRRDGYRCRWCGVATMGRVYRVTARADLHHDDRVAMVVCDACYASLTGAHDDVWRVSGVWRFIAPDGRDYVDLGGRVMFSRG